MNTNTVACKLTEKKVRPGSTPRLTFWCCAFPKNSSPGNFIARRFICKKSVRHHKPLVPNQETIEALEAVERGEFSWTGPVDQLLEHLNADD